MIKKSSRWTTMPDKRRRSAAAAASKPIRRLQPNCGVSFTVLFSIGIVASWHMTVVLISHCSGFRSFWGEETGGPKVGLGSEGSEFAVCPGEWVDGGGEKGAGGGAVTHESAAAASTANGALGRRGCRWWIHIRFWFNGKVKYWKLKRERERCVQRGKEIEVGYLKVGICNLLKKKSRRSDCLTGGCFKIWTLLTTCLNTLLNSGLCQLVFCHIINFRAIGWS